MTGHKTIQILGYKRWIEIQCKDSKKFNLTVKKPALLITCLKMGLIISEKIVARCILYHYNYMREHGYLTGGQSGASFYIYY